MLKENNKREVYSVRWIKKLFLCYLFIFLDRIWKNTKGKIIKKFIQKVILIATLTTNILFATQATHDNVIELYTATFDRAPTTEGLNYWLTSNLSIEEIAQSFFDQPETQEKYPEGFSDVDFINTIYNNVFDRDLDQEGGDYWQEELSSGSISRSKFILAIINGAHDDDVVILETKVHAVKSVMAKATPKKIIFLGDSITDGIGLNSPLTESYPSQVGLLLQGSNWTVENYGITSTTMLKKGSPSYWNTQEFTEAKNSQPDIVVIFLGLNDTKPKNWKYKNLFIDNYVAFINVFSSLDSQPEIFLILPTPSFGDLEGITDYKITKELIPTINEVASLLSFRT